MILAMLSLGVFATPARAQDATIEGTVTSQVTGLPIEFCDVFLYPAEWELAHQVPPVLDTDVTDALGDYTLEAPAGGGYLDYKVNFQPTDGLHLPEWWDSPVGARITDWKDATWLHVALGGTALGIDADLELTGSVAGTVTSGEEPLHLPIEGCTVTIYEKTGEDEYVVAGSTLTIADGTYYVGMLDTGEYLAQFSINDSIHLEQWYDGKEDQEHADEFDVVRGFETGNIDAELWVGASIQGLVTMQCGGDVVPNCVVEIIDANTGTPVIGQATDGFGLYTLGPLEGGDYKVSFKPTGLKAPQWYNGAESFDEATGLELERGDVAVNIDAQLTWDELNRYAVTPAGFDNLGSIVNSLGVLTEGIAVDAGGTSADEDLSNECLLPKFDTVFVNCTTHSQFDTLDISTIQDYVRDGGTLFASCCAGYKLISEAFPGKISFPADYPGQGLEQSVESKVLDNKLASIIGNKPEIEFDKNGFIIVTDVTPDVEVYITGTVEADSLGTITDMPLYMSFPEGDGEVWLTTFHSSAQIPDVGSGILRFFLAILTPPPVITGIEPDSGPIGTEVTITGRHFGPERMPEDNVTFGGQEAGGGDCIFWSDDQLIVAVPQGATTGDVTVTTLSGVSNSLSFTVTKGPGPTPPGPSKTWYLAEGSTGGNESGAFETWVLVQNPGTEDATVSLTYMTDDGSVPGPEITLKANSRTSLNVADTVPDTWSVSTKVTSDKPVIAERSVYWNTPGVSRQAAHDSIGANGPATIWYLAEGSTGANESGAFETWVLVQNPGTEDATVSLTYMTDDGSVPGPEITLKGNSRTSLNVADTVPDTWSVSTEVNSDKPVIAERSVYWNTPGVYRQAAHDSIGANGPATIWYLAEGSTGNNESGAFETWVLVQNPGEEDTTVYLTYMTDDGNVPGPDLILKANSRTSLNVADTVPDTWSVSTKVTSDKPVIAERSVYWNTPGVSRQAAHDSIGANGPATIWYLAEGSTGGNESGAFETWVLVQNPGTEDATVSLTYMTDDGSVPGPEITLKANSRTSLNVADTVPDTWSVSTKVTSDKPVIAERSVYWNTPGVYRQAAHDSIGVPGE